MNRAQQTIVGLIPAPDILNVPRVRFRPWVVLLPDLTDILASHFDERHHPLRIEIVNLLVHDLEVCRINALQIGNVSFTAGHFARKLNAR